MHTNVDSLAQRNKEARVTITTQTKEWNLKFSDQVTHLICQLSWDNQMFLQRARVPHYQADTISNGFVSELHNTT